MWWRDEQNPSLFDTISALVERWQTGQLGGVTAIGSTWDRFGQRVPFVGVEPRLLDHAAAGRNDLSFNLGGLAHASRWVPMEFFSRSQPKLRLPNRGFVAPVGRLRPLANRRGFHQGGRSGSLGCGLVTAQGQVATTAGHAVTQGGNLRWEATGPSRLLRLKPPYAGQVLAATSPDAQDTEVPAAVGVDLGIVELDRRNAPPVARALSLVEPQAVGIHHRCRWVGGRSGRHRGYVVAVCRVHNHPGEPYVNSYYVNGSMSWLPGMEGDSGSIVTDASGAALGHLLGTDGIVRRGLTQPVWVQDAHTAFSYARDKLGPIRAALYYG